MDHEATPHSGPELGMYACDQEMFERIWKRVMPEDHPDSPIAVSPPPARDTTSCAAPAPMSGVCVPEAAPAAEPEPVTPLPPDCPAPEPPACAEEAPPKEDIRILTSEAKESDAPAGDDFPRPEAVPCLGSSSAAHGSQLQEDIRTALEGWQLYRHLARRVTGTAARTLSALASEKHRQARKLAAAYFLISGVRYWPTDRLETPRFNSWLGTLRRRFTAEQQAESRCRAASLDTDDPCLADLYGELADGCAAHAGVLRTLLENAL